MRSRVLLCHLCDFLLNIVNSRKNVFSAIRNVVSGSRLRRLSIANQLTLILCCVLPVLWTFIIVELQSHKQQTFVEARKDTSNLARVLAMEVQASVHAIDLVILDLRDHWLEAPHQFSSAVANRRRNVGNDVVFQIAVIDRNGLLAYSSNDATAGKIDLSDREHFRVHRNPGIDELFISSPILGRVSKRWTIQLTRPILDKTGTFAGVIVLSVAPEFFMRFSSHVDLDKGSTVIIARSSGELLARTPEPRGGLQQTLKDVPFLHAAAGASGNFRKVSQLDGIEREVSWQALHRYALVIAVTQPIETIQAPYLHQKRVYLVIGTVLSILCCMTGWIFLRGLHQRALAHTKLTESEFRWKYALEGAGEGVWEWNKQTHSTFYSTKCKAMLGYADGEMPNRFNAWRKLLHPEDASAVALAFTDYITEKAKIFSCEIRLRSKDGSWKWVLSRGMAVEWSAEGRPMRMIGTNADITSRKRHEDAMQLALLVYENINEGMLVTDASNTIVAVNRAVCELTGYAQEELVGAPSAVLKSDHHASDFYVAVIAAINATGHWEGQIQVRRKSGDSYAEWVTVNTIFDHMGTVHRRVALFSNLAKKKEYEEIIWQQANSDPLTGLLNRRIFSERLEQEICSADGAGTTMALMFLDLDNFKEVNDTLGHSFGDLLLKEAAKRITGCIRTTDSVARLGGDEFTIILSDIDDADTVSRVADTLLQALAEPFHLDDETAFVGASMGITLYPQDADTSEALLRNADQAMYSAKKAGRSRFHFFTPSLQEQAQNRRRLANDLRNAVARQEFTVVYQPIVHLASGVVCKAEALIRWHHPLRGTVSPAHFIPIAEQTGIIDDISGWLFEKVTSDLVHIRAEYEPAFQISVNASPVQFRKKGVLPHAWLAGLREKGLPGSGIAVEITEGLLLEASSEVASILGKMRAAGMQISIDDFGTGYSSLSYIKKFAADYIKIDQSFIRNLTDGSEDMAICKAIILMAQTLGIKVIAEGIETDTQRSLLSAAGCDYGQGYLFARPLPLQEFNDALQKNISTRW